MAGTYADQVTLASTTSFVQKVQVALLFRANQNMTSTAAQNPAMMAVLAQAHNILSNGGSDAQRYAWIVATCNPTIAAAAPAIPSDGDTQYAVNTFMTQML